MTLEYIEYFQDIQVWNQKERTANCYNWFHYFHVVAISINLNTVSCSSSNSFSLRKLLMSYKKKFNHFPPGVLTDSVE